MKRSISLLLALVTALSLSACSRKDDRDNSSSSGSSSSSSSSTVENRDMLAEGKSLQSIIEEISAGFESGAVYQPEEVNAELIRTRYGLSDTMVDDYYGIYSTADGYTDQIVAVRAKPVMLEDVKRTLEKYRDDLAEQFKDKNENYAYDRIKNAQVYTRGDYAFLIAVNSLTPGSTATPMFDEDNKLVTEIINKSFL